MHVTNTVHINSQHAPQSVPYTRDTQWYFWYFYSSVQNLLLFWNGLWDSVPNAIKECGACVRGARVLAG